LANRKLLAEGTLRTVVRSGKTIGDADHSGCMQGWPPTSLA